VAGFLKKYNLGTKQGKKFFDTFKKMDLKKKGVQRGFRPP
jgi:hypothetical protein